MYGIQNSFIFTVQRPGSEPRVLSRHGIVKDSKLRERRRSMMLGWADRGAEGPIWGPMLGPKGCLRAKPQQKKKNTSRRPGAGRAAGRLRTGPGRPGPPAGICFNLLHVFCIYVVYISYIFFVYTLLHILLCFDICFFVFFIYWEGLPWREVQQSVIQA